MVRRRDRRTDRRRKRRQSQHGTTGIALGDPTVWGLLTALVVVGIAAHLITDTPQASSSPSTASLTVSPATKSLGEVSVTGGRVSTEFAVSNEGDQPITIHDMETSCMCTEATLVVDGVAGPTFGMRGHGPWPTEWAEAIPAGATATLRVDYDPAAHPDLRGPVTRVVRLYTDAADLPHLDAKLEIDQTD